MPSVTSAAERATGPATAAPPEPLTGHGVEENGSTQDRESRRDRALSAPRGAAPGLALAVLVAVVATPLGSLVPVIGGPVFGVVLGVVAATVIRPGAVLRPGLAVAAEPVLQLSIVLLGATLSLHQVATVGLGSLPVMLGTLTVALLGAWGLGGSWTSAVTAGC